MQAWLVSFDMFLLCMMFVVSVLLLWVFPLIRREAGGKAWFPGMSNALVHQTRVPGVTSSHLATFRAVYFVICMSCNIYSYIVSRARILPFFTVWNYHLQTAYFGLLLVDYILGDPKSEELNGSLRKKVIYVMNEVNIAMVYLVAIIFWGVLLPASLKDGDHRLVHSPTSYLQHGFNVPCLTIEFCLNRMLVHSRHVPFMMMWIALYGIFCVIYQLGGGASPYFFADIEKNLTPLWMAGVLGLSMGAFYILCYISKRIKHPIITKETRAIIHTPLMA